MDTLIQLQTIFNEIQTCDSRRFSENMSTVLAIIPRDSSFLRIIDSILVFPKSSLPPKVTYFVRRVFEELNETNKSIFNIILMYLLGKTYCKSTKIRKNSLRLINAMLAIEGDCCDDDLLAKIAEKLFDKEPSVRKEALKICIIFQNRHLSDSLTIQTTIKDIIRHDPSHDIRRVGFLGLELNESTLNCILERCVDSNMPIRKAFWMQYFPRIELEKLTCAQRIYLMKKGVNEREFNAKEIFLQKIRNYELDQFIEYFYCEEHEYELCVEEYLKNSTEEYEMIKYTPSYLHFLTCYYKIAEERNGRDALKLLPLDEFLQIFYVKCVELEKIAESVEDSTKQFKILKYFLKILGFYDLFTDDSKKYVLSIVNHIILACNFIPVVEECIVLLAKTCSDNLVKIAGGLIKKTRGRPICFSICEFVMKYLPFGEIHEAILNEIAILDIEQSTSLFFWYFVKNPNPNIESQYLTLLPNKKVVEGCADLALMGILDTSRIEDCLLTQLSRFNQNCVVPVSKLLLGKKLCSSEFVKYLLLIYYSTEADYIQQYLSLFFFEYFRINPQSLISVFCEVLELISSNHKVFVDQSLFWISNTENAMEYQSLYLSICIFIYNSYDALISKKHCFSVLSAVPVESSWDPMVTKKIITVLGLIIRKRPRENVNALLNQVMEIDDGTPLPPEEFENLKKVVKIQ
ncbi:uncharacterized protein VICG_00129 [Vittaforma corneae ATCC 50505]|uniref:Uncharacterized protein n=1 Tax=Vittaforma corneae (strain ATCC 50505) TaxID=993615 RepID=L2GQC1_VITCO|nr:uncharacterized protein VICG_00129 [Vittaforma corneae ATCC 50505]ELA42814.1 hypothetical protein VICG_00129 [Vittaforma corneae ATCC 50505]